MTNTPKPGPRLVFDKQWAISLVGDWFRALRDGLHPDSNEIANYYGETRGPFKTPQRLKNISVRWRLPGFRMPAAGIVKRILVEIGLRRGEAAMQERIAAHIIPLAQLFEHQKPVTFRGWTRACLDHFIRRYREADQEAASADYQPVFLAADRATIAVKRMRPRRGERSYQTATAETADTVAASLPPSKQNLSALKDRAQTLLPLLKGNEVTVFECLRSSDVTSQRDIVKATGLTEGAVSKILDRIIKKAG
jgi:hypothetical protein